MKLVVLELIPWIVVLKFSFKLFSLFINVSSGCNSHLLLMVLIEYLSLICSTNSAYICQCDVYDSFKFPMFDRFIVFHNKNLYLLNGRLKILCYLYPILFSYFCKWWDFIVSNSPYNRHINFKRIILLFTRILALTFFNFSSEKWGEVNVHKNSFPVYSISVLFLSL